MYNMTIVEFLKLSPDEQLEFVYDSETKSYRTSLVGTYEEIRKFLNNPEVEAIKDRLNFVIFDNRTTI